ncbi:MAG: hypothetical protein ACFB4I_20275 [Cyanophyceae cyanobacterium]
MTLKYRGISDEGKLPTIVQGEVKATEPYRGVTSNFHENSALPVPEHLVEQTLRIA